VQTATAVDLRSTILIEAARELQRRKLTRLTTVPPGAPYTLSQPQWDFLHETNPRKFMRAANGIGKSFEQALETWLLLLDEHPVYRVPMPNMGVFLVQDLDTQYADDICKILRELEPPGVLHESCVYNPTKGYTVGGKRGIYLKNGSREIFRSSHQQLTGLTGFKADHASVNEPPGEHLWSEFTRSLVMNANIPLSLAFTVVDDLRKAEMSLEWLKTMVGDPKNGWAEHVVPLTEAACPWRTPESIARQIADCLPGERAQRIYAEWDAPAIDRIFVGFDDRPYAAGGCVVTDADLAGLAPDVVQIGLGFDHAERPGGEIAILGCWWQHKGAVHGAVLDVYVSSGRTTPTVDADRVLDMLAARGLSPLAIDRARGDHNSAGKTSLTGINRELELAFAAATDSTIPPFAIQKARKGSGSVMYGVRVLNNALANGRLFVHERAKPLIHSFNNWRGKEMHKDAIDATRYLYTELLDPTAGGVAEVRNG